MKFAYKTLSIVTAVGLLACNSKIAEKLHLSDQKAEKNVFYEASSDTYGYDLDFSSYYPGSTSADDYLQSHLEGCQKSTNAQEYFEQHVKIQEGLSRSDFTITELSSSPFVSGFKQRLG